MAETGDIVSTNVRADEGPVVTDVIGSAARRYSMGGRGALVENVERGPNQTYLLPHLMSAHDEIEQKRDTVVRNARHVERINQHVMGGLTKKTNMVVGAQLRVTSIPDWRALGMEREAGVKWAREWGRLAESLFHSWAYDRRKLCDGEGHYSFGGMMWMGYRNLIGPDGEVAGAIQYDMRRARKYRSKWGTFMTMIDPQRIETPAERAGDHLVVSGRELDEWGRMTGFYINRARAGVSALEGWGHEFIPRETPWGRPIGFHWFQKYRGSAQRGITTLANTLKRTFMLDQFDSAQLGAAIVGAAMSTFIKTAKDAEDVVEALAPEGAEASSSIIDRAGYYRKLGLRIGSNRIPVLAPEDEIMIAAANKAAGDPSAFRKGYMREFAVGAGLSTPQFSGDYSDTNYSSERSALIDIWRGVMSERVFFSDAVPSLAFAAVMEEAVVKGWLPLPEGGPNFYEAYEAYTRCVWTGPGMGWIDPKKEAEAAQIRVDPKAPLSTLADEAALQGRTVDELIEARGEEQAMLVEAGLIPDPATAGDNQNRTTSEEDDAAAAAEAAAEKQ